MKLAPNAVAWTVVAGREGKSSAVEVGGAAKACYRSEEVADRDESDDVQEEEARSLKLTREVVMYQVEGKSGSAGGHARGSTLAVVVEPSSD